MGVIILWFPFSLQLCTKCLRTGIHIRELFIFPHFAKIRILSGDKDPNISQSVMCAVIFGFDLFNPPLPLTVLTYFFQ